MKRYKYIRRIVDRLTSSDSNNEEFILYNHLVGKQSGMEASSPPPYIQAQTDIRERLPTSVMTIGRIAFISRMRRADRQPMP